MAANATRSTWQWSGEAAKVPSAAASSTGKENHIKKETETTGGIPYARTTWKHAEEAEDGPAATSTTPGAFVHFEEEFARQADDADRAQQQQQQRHYQSRKCRICLEVVHPTIRQPAEGIAGLLNPTPVVEYISEDPESGRLIRPCKCKGSMKWIHEGCLTEWRRQDPGSSNYWQCTTCHFEYRLQRINLSRAISNKATQITLTMFILFITVFLLGFVADPIINLYLDPYEVITSGGLTEPIIEETGTWVEHLSKGLASLGVLGMLKAIFAMGPWQWLNIRNTGVFGGRRGRAATGRDRIANISWYLIAFGVLTFLWAVYKLVKAWSCRILDMAGERVVDVQGDDDEDGDDDAE